MHPPGTDTRKLDPTVFHVVAARKMGPPHGGIVGQKRGLNNISNISAEDRKLLAAAKKAKAAKVGFSWILSEETSK